MSTKTIISKNFLSGVLGIIPLGSLPDALINTIIEISEDKKNTEAQMQLRDLLNELTERISYIESQSDEYSNVIDFPFNRSLDDNEVDRFRKFVLEDSEIPFDHFAEMYDDFAGITIYLDEPISGYVIYKAKKLMDNLIKKVAPDLSIDFDDSF